MDLDESLHTLDGEELERALLALARQARVAALEGDDPLVADLLERVRSAAETASGEAAPLLNVAEAFLRIVARGDLGRNELALRRFFLKYPKEAEIVFALLVDQGTILRSQVSLSRGASEFENLFTLGVLRDLGEGRIDLRPALRPVARDLMDPLALRMWRKVDSCRGQIALAGMSEATAAGYLSSELGIGLHQAARHVEQFRLVAGEERKRVGGTSDGSPLPVRNSPTPLIYTPVNAASQHHSTVLQIPAPLLGAVDKENQLSSQLAGNSAISSTIN